MKKWFLIMTLFSFLPAHAIVDMKNANYSNTWVDLEVPGSGYELKITRTYNSRSLFDGMFGFGWCSDFETKIDITAEGNLKLTECGAGQEIYYMPREFGRKEIDKTIAQIASKIRASKKFDEKMIKRLSEDMVANHDLRAKYALEYRVAIPVKEGSQFYANGQEVENITFKNKVYTRHFADGSFQRFDGKGHLTHFYDKNGNYLKFDYDKERVATVSDNNGRQLNIKYYPNKKVRLITGPNSLSAEYKYSNVEDLTWVKNAWTNTYTYEYDELHNMTKATYPDNTFVALKYDKKNDWVTSFTDREKCVEEYGYEFSESDPKNHYWSTVKKTCNKQVVNESRHEFWYKERPDGEVILQRVASTVNGHVTEIAYHEVFGKPISIRRGPETYSFDYYPNGQVKTKISRFARLTYEYNPQNRKVSRVTMATFDIKGKQLATKKTEFKYNDKGNLTWAANTDGQKIEIAYDPAGRIASIVDQAKKLVKLQYDPKFGKPAVVTRPGLGTIHVTYKQNGDIDKINSPEGATIAMQVASTFNNYLEIISPATAEIYN